MLALVDRPGTDDYRTVLRRGATTAADRAGDVNEVVRALEAAVAGITLLPRPVAAALAAAGGPPGEMIVVNPIELRWLRAMASGVSVDSLAKKEGYSGRELFRMLHDLYGRMGAQNRSQAIAQAARWGLLDRA